MKALFKNPSIQEQFDRQGYVVLSMLDEPSVRQLLDLYQEQIEQSEVSGLYESSRHNDYEQNRQINTAIYEAFQPSWEKVFAPSRLYGGTFMVKSHRDSEMLPLHQDWSVVDEEKYNTLFIWCPLMAVGPANGGLFVLEGSHHYFNTLRSGTYPSNRYLLPPQLHRFTKNIHLKPGEAIMYSDQLFHGSFANDSAADRIVVTARVMEEEAELVYFHKKNEKTVDVYKASQEFYLSQIDRIAKGQKPLDIPKLYSRPYQHVPVTDASLRAKIDAQFEPLKQKAMTCDLFKDPAIQKAFERDGYVVLDLIDEAMVESLLDFYKSIDNAPMPEYGFQVSLDNQSSDFVEKVSHHLTETVRPNVDAHFKDHQIFTASFLIKEKNPLGVVPPHQDWSFVDEHQYWSATLWCPLVDTDMHNGGLGLIKGSHLFYDHPRPSPSPQYEPPFKSQLFDIFPYLKIINLKKGQALVFNNKTLHASPPNTSDQKRIAFGIGITHQDAKLRHYYLLPEQEQPRIEAYQVDKTFFNSYNNARLKTLSEAGKKPEGLQRIGLFDYTYKAYDSPQLIEMIKAAGNEKDEVLLEKMARVFGYNMDGTPKETASVQKEVYEEQKPFWKVYTPINIYREIMHRLGQ